MKILILANFDVGLYKFRKELIRTLLQRGDEVILSLPDGELVRELKKMGCRFLDTPVDRRGIDPVTDMKLFLRYCRIIKQEKPELVITYTIKPNIYGGMACRWYRVPYAVNITGLGTAFQKKGLLKQLVVFLYKTALKRAKTVFFENAENRRELLKLHIVKKKQTKLLDGAGVNLEDYPFTEYPDETEGIRFLFVGRVMKEKGVDELFHAAIRFYKKHKKVQFDFVGPMEDDYKTIVERLTEKGIIRYHGYQEDVKPFIRNCHCFVLPSYHEGMANTNLECASMGRPLITSDIAGCREAVLEGKSGLLCKPQNTESLYETMEKFCRMTEKQHREMGRRSRRHMEERFDKKKVVRETVGRLFG